MCGIALLLCYEATASAADKAAVISSSLRRDIGNRGTSSCNECNPSRNLAVSHDMICMAAVLHIQGEEPAIQPLADAAGNVLLWNGEVFDGIELEKGSSDTVAISVMLGSIASSHSTSHQEFLDQVAVQMSQIHGPYSFIYYNAQLDAICYGRDPFGRRSLLSLDSSSDIFALASCNSAQGSAGGDEWSELPIGGLFLLPLLGQEAAERYHAAWPLARVTLARPCKKKREELVYGHPTRAAPEFLAVLQRALTRRVDRLGRISSSTEGEKAGSDSCTVGVLFSGGIDSVLLAAVLHSCVDPALSIDLLNVTFDEKDATNIKSFAPSPDRLAAVAAARELEVLYPTREWRLVHVDIDAAEREAHEGHIVGLIKPLNTYMDLNIGTAFWFAARGQGYLRNYSDDEVDNFFNFKDNDVPLLRVSRQGGSEPIRDIVSERGGCLSSRPAEELNKGCPTEGCRWVAKKSCAFNMCSKCCRLACNTRSAGDEQILCRAHSKRERKNHRKIDGKQGGEPTTAVAQEIVTENDTSDVESEKIPGKRMPYVTACKVLLVGIGADEQLAGYGRHRTVHRKDETIKQENKACAVECKEGADTIEIPLSLLEQELDKDVTRLWKRNLGRDDRCVADHARELWIPFLDEELVKFIQSLAIDEIADLSLESGIGDKMILREAAKLLGLSPRVCGLVKRAIQFGTRVAKHTNRKIHGSNRKAKGDMTFGNNMDDDEC